MIRAVFIYKLPRYFLSSFESIGLSVQGKKSKIDFQDGDHGSHFGFPMRIILTTFDLQISPVLLTKVWVNWPLGSGEKAQNRFSTWPPWPLTWIFKGNGFSYFFYLQITLILPIKFWVNGRFGLGEGKHYFFQDGGHLSLPIKTILTIIIYKLPWYFLPSFESLGLSVQENKQKIKFQDDGHGSHFGFSIGTIIAILDLQVVPTLPTKFGVN